MRLLDGKSREKFGILPVNQRDSTLFSLKLKFLLIHEYFIETVSPKSANSTTWRKHLKSVFNIFCVLQLSTHFGIVTSTFRCPAPDFCSIPRRQSEWIRFGLTVTFCATISIDKFNGSKVFSRKIGSDL